MATEKIIPACADVITDRIEAEAPHTQLRLALLYFVVAAMLGSRFVFRHFAAKYS